MQHKMKPPVGVLQGTGANGAAIVVQDSLGYAMVDSIHVSSLVAQGWTDDTANALAELSQQAAALGLVGSIVDPFTGGIEFISSEGRAGRVALLPEGQALTTTGSFVGNSSGSGSGASQSINLGWEPDFLIIKSAAAQTAVMQTKLSWYNRTDSWINEESIGNASTTNGGVTITSAGFTVGENLRVNGAGATIYYFAYRDQRSHGFLQSSYAGNAQSGRVVDNFEQRPLAAAICKRDYTPAPVFMFRGQSAWYWDGSKMAVSVGTSLSAEGTTITTGAGNEINGWTGALGEAMGLYGIPLDGRACTAMTYTGNGTASRRINLPWEVDAFLIVPLNGTTATSGRLWINGLAANTHLPIGAGASGTNVITVVSENTIVLNNENSVNQNGLLYGLIAWRKCRASAPVDLEQTPSIYTKCVQMPAGGYINCGTDNSLALQGPITLEWYGSAHPPSTTPMAGGPGVDSEGSKQAPIMFRSGGDDGTRDAVSYGFEQCAPTAHDSSMLSRGASLLVSTYDRWTLPQDGTMPNLDPYPANTGFVLGGRKPQHVIVTDDRAGTIRVYVDGNMVKERKRDLTATYGNSGKSYPGHSLVFGARKESSATPTDANSHSFRMARIYNRVLTPDEVRNNYLSVFGYRDAIDGFVEQWDARKASGNTLPATVNSANNGTIINGSIEGF